MSLAYKAENRDILYYKADFCYLFDSLLSSTRHRKKVIVFCVAAKRESAAICPKNQLTMKCSKCNLEIASEVSIKCNTCLDNFHYGCVGLSEAEFKRILPMNIKKWKCLKCKQPKKLSVPSTLQTSPKSPIILNEQSNDNCNPLPSIVSIDTDALLTNMNNKFKQLFEGMAELKNSFNIKLDGLFESIQSLTGRLHDLEQSVLSIQADLGTETEKNEILQAEVAAITQDNTVLRHQLSLLSGSLDDQEQHSRQCNIEIQNLPERKNENLIHIAVAVGRVLGIPIVPDTIKAVHRVAHNAKTERPKNVIVELSSRRLRDDVIAAARARRGLSVGQIMEAAIGTDPNHLDQQAAARPIFINEHLTLKNKILYAKTRKEATTKGFKFVWIKNAAILVRKEDKSKVRRIRSESDLAEL